jgi:signal transduction histidine kinase
VRHCLFRDDPNQRVTLMKKNPQEIEQTISELRRCISFLESLKADRVDAEDELCRLGSIVENSDDAIIEFEPSLSVRRINWLEPPATPEFCTDKRAIERVFGNLVENALKYGGEKLTEIEIEYKDSEKFHTLCVTDDGAGIEGEDPDRVFNMFHRRDTTNSIEGTGMGLAIVKEIAEKHKGKAWAAHGRNGGASFCVSISKKLYVERETGEVA